MAEKTADRVAPPADDETWTVDQLAQRSGIPVRTIREYQTMALLHRPRRAGRVGIYGLSHLRRLDLIGRLQDRGYSLAGIADLLASWRRGDDIGEVLGLAPDQLVHVDEPGAQASVDQLARLVPGLVLEHFEQLLATGTVEKCGTDRYCVPSPSLLQLAADALDAGIGPDATLKLLAKLRTAADAVTDAVLAALAELPVDASDQSVARLVGRGRGLLAHGVGRLTIHRLGHQLDIDDETSDEPSTTIRRRGRASETNEPQR